MGSLPSTSKLCAALGGQPIQPTQVSHQEGPGGTAEACVLPLPVATDHHFWYRGPAAARLGS